MDTSMARYIFLCYIYLYIYIYIYLCIQYRHTQPHIYIYRYIIMYIYIYTCRLYICMSVCPFPHLHIEISHVHLTWLRKITTSAGETHSQWPCSIAFLLHQGVSNFFWVTHAHISVPDIWLRHSNMAQGNMGMVGCLNFGPWGQLMQRKGNSHCCSQSVGMRPIIQMKRAGVSKRLFSIFGAATELSTGMLH